MIVMFSASVSMSAVRKLVLVAVLLLSLPRGGWAADGCTRISEVISVAGGTRTDLSDRPVRICSVEFIATASNGWAQLYDSPDDTPTHGQAYNLAEPGAATSGNSVFGWFGESGKTSRYGLDVETQGGRVIIHWADSQ